MREIKFRGLQVGGGGWVYGYFLHVVHLNGLGNGVNYDRHQIYEQSTRITHDVIPESVGQFTGLKDKHGKEIFEGDFLHFYEPDSAWLFSVVYTDSKACFSLESPSRYMDFMAIQFAQKLTVLYQEHFEVVGNIHENANSDK